MATTFELHRFSVDDYGKMLESGILVEGKRVELIDGEVRCMSPIGTRHYAMVNYLTRQLVPMVGDAGIVSVQNPIQLDNFTEPEPDLTVSRWRADFYGNAKIRPADILLLIEVADSSLHYDRHEKLPRYARVGIPEVWIVDIEDELPKIEQYSAPVADTYSIRKIHAVGETVLSVSLPELVRFKVTNIYGERSDV